MKSFPERLNDRLEQLESSNWPGEHSVGDFMALDHQAGPDIDELVTLARRFQASPQLQVAPAFANQLERRMLRHHLELQQQKQRSRGWSIMRLLRVHPALATMASLCLLLLVLSTGILALAASTNNPLNPLYGVKQWEQHVRSSLASSPADQATLDLQFARDQLNMLASLTAQGHAGAYRQALNDLDQQITNATGAINALPTGTQQTQLEGELGSLKNEARQKLRGLLPGLTLSESLETTDELARLGDSVPRLTDAILLLPAHPNGSATIRIVGSGIQPGAQLLLNERPVQATSTQQSGQVVFTLDWNGEQHPYSLGILNPDGTVAEMTTISIEGDPDSNGNGNGNKPSGTPTPHGNKPPTTPIPRH